MSGSLHDLARPRRFRFWTSNVRAARLVAGGGVSALFGIAEHLSGDYPLSAAFMVAGLLLGAAWFCGMFWLFATRPTLTVGRDGVLMTRRRERRFVAAAAIRQVRVVAFPNEAASDLRARLEIDIPGGETVAFLGSKADAEAAEEAVDELIRAAETSKLDARLVARRTSSTREWVGMLRGLAEGARSSYRTPAPRETLLRIVESPEARPVHRAAAALAASSERGAGSVFLRAAAETASPLLRSVLRGLARHAIDDTRLANALDELELDGTG